MKVLRAALVAACLAAPLAALAQDYPARPIRVVVTSSPGSTGDTTLRILGPALDKLLGQPVVVENIPGSGGVAGTEKVVRAPADGYTLGLISNNHAINPHIIRNIPFDSEKDIAAISVVGSTPIVLVVNPGVPAKTTQELIALAKAKPGSLNYGSAGNGTVLHLAGVLFTSEAGIDIKHVPYKGLGQMTADLLGGQIEMGWAGVATVAPQIKAGKLRAIAVTSTRRSGVLPDVPTLAESGLPNYRFEGWLALVGPAALPRPIVDRVHKAVTTALAQKDVPEALAAQGVIPEGSAPEAARQFIQGEMDKHAQLVKRSGAKLE
jgi:tripartite-type tricarboxylate transporter receptor subunit TctC